MSKVLTLSTSEATSAIHHLFEQQPPVLVEVRFTNMGTSPDWHFCEHEDELESLLDTLGAGVELHLHSVWDLTNQKGAICLRK